MHNNGHKASGRVRGFKPAQVREAVGITQAEFKNWRSQIDWDNKRGHFSVTMLLIYRSIKVFLRHTAAELKDLAQLDWSPLVAEINGMQRSELRQCYLVFHVDEKWLRLVHKEEEIVLHPYHTRKIDMGLILEENEEAILNIGSGTENVSSIFESKAKSSS